MTNENATRYIYEILEYFFDKNIQGVTKFSHVFSFKGITQEEFTKIQNILTGCKLITKRVWYSRFKRQSYTLKITRII